MTEMMKPVIETDALSPEAMKEKNMTRAALSRINGVPERRKKHAERSRNYRMRKHT